MAVGRGDGHVGIFEFETWNRKKKKKRKKRSEIKEEGWREGMLSERVGNWEVGRERWLEGHGWGVTGVSFPYIPRSIPTSCPLITGSMDGCVALWSAKDLSDTDGIGMRHKLDLGRRINDVLGIVVGEEDDSGIAFVCGPVGRRGGGIGVIEWGL